MTQVVTIIIWWIMFLYLYCYNTLNWLKVQGVIIKKNYVGTFNKPKQIHLKKIQHKVKHSFLKHSKSCETFLWSREVQILNNVLWQNYSCQWPACFVIFTQNYSKNNCYSEWTILTCSCNLCQTIYKYTYNVQYISQACKIAPN